MRQVPIIFLLVFTLSLMLTGAQQIDFDGAAQAYHQGDYQTAIEIYELGIANHQRSGEVFYNLGNAYVQADLQGYALLNYLRAAAYLPRDADVHLRTARIRSERRNIISGSGSWLQQVGTVTDKLLTLRELSIIALSLWFSLATVISIARSRRGSWSINIRAMLGVLILTFSLFAALLFTRLYVRYQQPAAVVIEDAAVVYSGADESYLRLFTLYAAAEVRVIDRQGDWVKITLADGRQGWLLDSSLAYITQNLS